MMRRLVCLAILLAPSLALGQERQFKNGEAVTLEPDKAYILARTFEAKGPGIIGPTIRFAPILARLLSQEELRQAEALRQSDPDNWQKKAAPNVVAMMPDEPYAQAGPQSVLLTAVKPGTYILAGVSFVSWGARGSGPMVSSLCMGTVKFEVRPGVITDLGEILAAQDDAPTTIPELAGVVRGKESGFMGVHPYTVAVRPVGSATLVPAALAALQPAPADYRAMPAYPNYPGTHLSRLAPLAGVLDYDKNGDVVDLKAAHAP